MGYVVTSHGLGGGNPAWGVATGDVPQCSGGELKQYQDGSSSSLCCPDNTWDEITYRNVKGDSNTQHYLEERIHAALWMLAPGELANAAWDSGFEQDVSVSSTLTSRTTRAVQNFKDLFPSDRWVKVPDAIETYCAKYSEWRGGYGNQEVRTAALNRILGAGYTQAQFDAFAQKAKNVIWGVPRNINFSYEQPPIPSKDLLIVQNAQLQPTPWLASFLDTFAPIREVTAASAMRSGTVSKYKKPSSQVLAQRAAKSGFNARQSSIVPEGGESKNNTAYYVLGGVALLAIGAGLWFKFKK